MDQFNIKFFTLLSPWFLFQFRRLPMSEMAIFVFYDLKQPSSIKMINFVKSNFSGLASSDQYTVENIVRGIQEISRRKGAGVKRL